jgi:hypothetical protein
MSKKNKKIPFNWLPASWGLSGKSRERAEAEYYFEGYDLEKRLIEIDYEDNDEREVEFLRLDHKHGKIDDYTFALKYAERTLSGEALEIRKLELDHTAGKITLNEYEKRVANIKKEPYITVLNSEYNPDEGIGGLIFEFDWNEYWIKQLIDHGYSGYNEDQIIHQWFTDLCRSTIAEEIDSQDIPFNSGRVINTIRRGNRSDFS